jgi:hypothetical protein
MHEIFSLVSYLFCNLSITNRYKTQYNQHFSKIFKFDQIFEIFDHSPFPPKVRSITERCRRKRGVNFSVAFATVRP